MALKIFLFSPTFRSIIYFQDIWNIFPRRLALQMLKDVKHLNYVVLS